MTTRRTAIAAIGGAIGGVIGSGGTGARAAEAALPADFDAWRRRFDARAGHAGLVGPDALLAEAESQLAAGDAAAALDTLQRAAAMAHAAAIECTIVRAQAQAGQYRQALAFAAHAALAHRAQPGGVALYAWLLHVGGQSVVAARLVDDALRGSPDDAALVAARARLRAPWPQPEGVLLAPPLRCAPYAHGPGPDTAAARCAGSALLVDAGRGALLPCAVVGTARRLWLRNGLGHTVQAVPRARCAPDGLLQVDLATPLAMPAVLPLASREPFAGSPVAAVEYPVRTDAAPAWPVLRQGFAGRAQGGRMLLGVAMPAGPRGGPVFDRSGSLAGIALADADGRDRLLPLSALPVGAVAADGRDGAAAALALDAVYENALRLTLQVLVDDPA